MPIRSAAKTGVARAAKTAAGNDATACQRVGPAAQRHSNRRLQRTSERTGLSQLRRQRMPYNRLRPLSLQAPTMRMIPTLLFVTLALVMAATRIHHFAVIPDASWAVFFVAGFYFSKQMRWAFPALIVLALLADWYAIATAGMSFWGSYCISPAYWFLLPAYASLWVGGSWLARHETGLRWRSLGLLGAALLVSVSACYLLSNGSFYWISNTWGGVDAQRSLGGWVANLGHWYLPFLKVTAMYVATAALLHAVVLAAGLGRKAATGEPARHG